MKRTSNFLTIAAACMAAALSGACKKADSGKQQTNHLTSASWKAPKSEWRTTGGTWASPPSWASQTGGYPPTITFLDNGTYTTGSTSGSSGSWQLSADGRQLVLIGSNGSSMTATIDAMTTTTLQLSKPMDPQKTYTIEGSSPNYKYTYYDTERTTFSH
jgi:hypothetical protein